MNWKIVITAVVIAVVIGAGIFLSRNHYVVSFEEGIKILHDRYVVSDWAAIKSLDVEVVQGPLKGPLIQANAIVVGEFGGWCTDKSAAKITTQRDGNMFLIIIKTSSLSLFNFMGCAGTPHGFREVIPLDTSGLKPGTYTVTVNRVIRKTFVWGSPR